jgi:hypothetical protein
MTTKKAFQYNADRRMFIIYLISLVCIHFVLFYEHTFMNQFLIGFGEFLLFWFGTRNFIKSITFGTTEIFIEYIWPKSSSRIDYSSVNNIYFKKSGGYSLDYSSAYIKLNPREARRKIMFAIDDDDFYTLAKYLDKFDVKCTTPNNA